MMLSIMVVGAGAVFADQKDIDTKHQQAVDMCNALNIITGFENGKFMPKDNVTREQTAKMICVLLNGGKDPVLGAGSSSFTDVANDRWSCPYIESCVSQDIIVGVGGNKFAPAGKVTGSQLAKMLLVALGFSPDHQKYAGSAWEVNVNTDASAKGFYDKLEDINPSDPLTREHAAQMIWNALNAYEVEYKTVLATENGQLTSKTTVQDKVVAATNDKITLLEDKYETRIPTGILQTVVKEEGKDTYKVTVNGTTYSNIATDYSKLLGQDVKVLYKPAKNGQDAEIYGVYATSKNTVVTGLANDLDKLNGTNGKLTLDDVTYKTAQSIPGNTPVKVTPSINDAVPADMNNLTKLAANYPYFELTLIDNNDDDKMDIAIVTPFVPAQVSHVSSASITMKAVATKGTLAMSETSPDIADIDLYDGAAKDDYVAVVDASYTVNDTTVVSKMDVVSGTVDGVRGTDGREMQTNDTWYNLVTQLDPYKLKVSLNDGYDFAVKNGFVFGADATESTVSASNILFIDDIGTVNSGVSHNVEAVAYFSDGSHKTIKISKLNGLKVYDESPDAANESKYSSNQFGNHYHFLRDAYNTNNIGEIFKFTLKDSGEYELKSISTGNKGIYDNYYDVDQSRNITSVKDGTVTTTLDGIWRHADNAVIFVKGSDDTKVITGKQVQSWADIPTMINGTAGPMTISKTSALTSTSNGYEYAKIGAFVMASGTEVPGSNDYLYAYVTSKVVTSGDNADTYTFTAWNGTESLELKTEDTGVAKGMFIAYAENGDKVDIKATKTVENDSVAIQGFDVDSKTKTITFSDRASTEFTDTYKVIGVNTKDVKGVEGGTLDTASFIPGNDTVKYKNAVYFMDGEKVAAVFVDNSGIMYNGNGQKMTTNGTIDPTTTAFVNVPQKTLTYTKTGATIGAAVNFAEISRSYESGSNVAITGTAAAGTFTRGNSYTLSCQSLHFYQL